MQVVVDVTLHRQKMPQWPGCRNDLTIICWSRDSSSGCFCWLEGRNLCWSTVTVKTCKTSERVSREKIPNRWGVLWCKVEWPKKSMQVVVTCILKWRGTSSHRQQMQKTRTHKRRSPEKLPSQVRASIEPFLKFQALGTVTYVESNGFRQSNLLIDHHFSIDPHTRVSQVEDACCAILFLKKWGSNL